MKVLKKGSGGLIRTPLQELERYEIEQELREVEHDREYNQQLFDPIAMREIQLRNQNAQNAVSTEDETKLQLDLSDIKKSPFAYKKGKLDKYITKKEILARQEEERLKEVDKKKKSALEQQKFQKLKNLVNNQMLGNIRGANYASTGALRSKRSQSTL